MPMIRLPVFGKTVKVAGEEEKAGVTSGPGVRVTAKAEADTALVMGTLTLMMMTVMITSARAESLVLESTVRLSSTQSIEMISLPTLYRRPAMALQSWWYQALSLMSLYINNMISWNVTG